MAEASLTVVRAPARPFRASAFRPATERWDPVATILEYAREHGITQPFVGHNLHRDGCARLRGSPLDRLIEGADGMDVRVFPHRS